jgi:hypothetical protein
MAKLEQGLKLVRRIQQAYEKKDSKDVTLRHKHLALLNYIFFQPLNGALTTQYLKDNLTLDNIENILSYLEKESFLLKEPVSIKTKKFFTITLDGLCFLVLCNRSSFDKNYLLDLNNVILDLTRIKYFESKINYLCEALTQKNEVNTKYFIEPILSFNKLVEIDNPNDVKSFSHFIRKISLSDLYIHVATERLKKEIELDVELESSKRACTIWKLARESVLVFLDKANFQQLSSDHKGL